LLALWIEFRQDIVKQKQWRDSAEACDQFQLGQLESEHEAALLASRAKSPCWLTPQQQGHVIPLWSNAAVAQARFLWPLLLQLIQQALLPNLLILIAVEFGPRLVVELQLFATAAESFLPGGGQWLQPLEGSVAATMQPSANHSQLLVKGIQQLITVAQLPFQQL
jgi:hypothetical protein